MNKRVAVLAASVVVPLSLLVTSPAYGAPHRVHVAPGCVNMCIPEAPSSRTVVRAFHASGLNVGPVHLVQPIPGPCEWTERGEVC